MAEHYIEEYLVSLGFDLDTDTGKEYRKMLDDIEKRQKTFDKENTNTDHKRQESAKKRVTDTKKENDNLLDVEKTMRKIASLTKQMGEGNVFGSLIAGGSSVRTLQTFLKNLGEASGDTASGKSGRMLSGALKKHASESAKAADYTESGKGIQAGMVQQKGIQAGITGETAGAGAGEAGALGGAAAVAIPVAVVAAMLAAVVASNKIADNLATANLSVESMSKQMWITDRAAWQLNNTLTAMGKTTADLNDIALNPVLREQFKTLQDYQKTTLQLPSDFKAVNDAWSAGVQTANEKLKMSNALMKELLGYNLQKAFQPFMEQWYSVWNKVAVDIDKLLGANKETVVNNAGSRATSSLINGAAYAPQTSSYGTANSGNLTIQNSPNITVYPMSGDPQSIGSAVGDAVGSSLDDVALIKSVQGMNR